MSEKPREESDQLPEEAPGEQVVDDTAAPPPGDRESPGGAGEEGHGTGHPDHRPPGDESEHEEEGT